MRKKSNCSCQLIPGKKSSYYHRDYYLVYIDYSAYNPSKLKPHDDRYRPFSLPYFVSLMCAFLTKNKSLVTTPVKVEVNIRFCMNGFNSQGIMGEIIRIKEKILKDFYPEDTEKRCNLSECRLEYIRDVPSYKHRALHNQISI